MKNLQCKLTRKRWLEIGVSVLLFVLIIAWALVLEYTEPDREATAARKRFFAVARVTDILDDNAETQDWTEGRRIGQQYLEVEILNGPWKGETLEAINYLTIYTNVDAKIGTKIVVRLDLDDEGAPYIISIPNSKNSQSTPIVIEKQNATIARKTGESSNLMRRLRLNISTRAKPNAAQMNPFIVWSIVSHSGYLI